MQLVIDLSKWRRRGAAPGRRVLERGKTVCCYAQSEKSWIEDPAGISWEAFFTTGESTIYSDGTGEARFADAESAATLSACRGT